MSLPNSKLNIRNLFPVTKIGSREYADFWNAYKITNEFKSQTGQFDTYEVSDLERWDIIAQQIYDDRELWWIIPLFNDIEDPFAIYFDRYVPSSIKELKILKKERLPLVLTDIREKLLEAERIRQQREEKERQT